MFPRRYFAGRYFAPRYFPESDGDPPIVTGVRLYVAGHVIDATTGALGYTLNATPSETDPFINGLRQSPNGGAYLKDTGTPVTP